MKQSEEKVQISESLLIGILLTLSGGFMDSYSYIVRNHVFANAQTGNILLLGVNLSQGQWRVSCYYLSPIVAFIIGIAGANILRNVVKKSYLYWQQYTLLFEILVIAFSAFMFTLVFGESNFRVIEKIGKSSLQIHLSI